jgi:hypothetical protein
MDHLHSQSTGAVSRCVAALIAILIIGGCGASKKTTSSDAVQSATAQAAADPPNKASVTACEMVTQAEVLT